MSVRSIAVNYSVNTGPAIAANRAMATSFGQVAAAQQTATNRMAAGAAGAKKFATSAGLITPTLLGAAGVVMALKQTVGASVKFQHEFASVEKTVGGSQEVLARVAGTIRGLAKEMPTTTTELNAVAAAAGQLGVQANQIGAFTKEMAMMGVATDLSSDQAAMSFARIANITNTPLEKISELTSVSVALGNSFAAQESEIVNFATRIAGAGSQVGMTTDQIFALSTALPAMGLQAEMGGSAVSRIMVEIATAVDEGGDKLEEFARVSGQSADRFSAAWRDDAANTLLVFLEGLQKAGAAGESTFAIIDELGLANIRTQDTLLRGASAAGEYSRALTVAGKEMGELTALENEYETFASTTASQSKIFANNLKDAALTAGNDLKPALDGILSVFNDMMDMGGPEAGVEATKVTIDDFRRKDFDDGLGGILRGMFGLNLGQWIEDLGAVGDAATTLATTHGQKYLDWLGEAARAGDVLANKTLRDLQEEHAGTGTVIEEQIDRYVDMAAAQRLADGEVTLFTNRMEAQRQAAREAALASQDNAEATYAAAGAYRDASTSIEAYLEDIRRVSDPVYRLEAAVTAVDEAEDALREARESGKATDEELTRLTVEKVKALEELEAAALAGDLSFAAYQEQLDGWVEKGMLTREEAGLMAARVGELIDVSEEFTGDYEARYLANIDQERLRIANRLLNDVGLDREARFLALPEEERLRVANRLLNDAARGRRAEYLASADPERLQIANRLLNEVSLDRETRYLAEADADRLQIANRLLNEVAGDRTVRLNVTTAGSFPIAQLQGGTVRINHAGGHAGTGPLRAASTPLASDEVPIIAQKGEHALTAAAARRLAHLEGAAA